MLSGMEFITPADEEPTAEPSQEEAEATDPED